MESCCFLKCSANSSGIVAYIFVKSDKGAAVIDHSVICQCEGNSNGLLFLENGVRSLTSINISQCAAYHGSGIYLAETADRVGFGEGMRVAWVSFQDLSGASTLFVSESLLSYVYSELIFINNNIGQRDTAIIMQGGSMLLSWSWFINGSVQIVQSIDYKVSFINFSGCSWTAKQEDLECGDAIADWSGCKFEVENPHPTLPVTNFDFEKCFELKSEVKPSKATYGYFAVVALMLAGIGFGAYLQVTMLFFDSPGMPQRPLDSAYQSLYQ
jgi:hypothetical protein